MRGWAWLLRLLLVFGANEAARAHALSTKAGFGFINCAIGFSPAPFAGADF
jgi:hypothetical protein